MTGLKRSSVAVSATTGASSKKRRTDSRKEPKFYAVRAGKAPGVYLTWPECQEQISGFSGAQFKAFPSLEDAHEFVAGNNPVTVGEPEKFYAVAVGNPPGIYTAWTAAQEALKGVSGPKYKRFATREEAEEYIAHHTGNAATGGSKKASAKEAAGEEDAVTAAAPARKSKMEAKKDETGTVTVWTDGSSLSNGRVGAAAGVGVWFGISDERNISEALPGEPQTNQRAELMAIKRALETVSTSQHLHIKSDSQYAINCVTQWAVGWARKEWKTSGGQDVKNKDIIQPILDLLKEREGAGAVTDWSWVKGHSSDLGNDCADRLAVAGAKKGLRARTMGKPVAAAQKQERVVAEEVEDKFEFGGDDEDEFSD